MKYEFKSIQDRIKIGDICDINFDLVYDKPHESRKNIRNCEFLGFRPCKWQKVNENSQESDCYGCKGEMCFKTSSGDISDCFNYRLADVTYRVAPIKIKYRSYVTIGLPDELFEI